MFKRLDPAQTGLKFVNALPENAQLNVLEYAYYYNGGGVGIGDVNNDGRPDIYMTGNLVASRLFLNRGNMQFQEVTQAAGVVNRTPGWKTGVAMADVNGDGWLDIYVCRSGNLGNAERENELFINQGDGRFEEQAAAYGLNDPGYSTQASFFDYDRDGDLDMYLLNHALDELDSKVSLASLKSERHPYFGDKLYRNDNGRFTDVSAQAGIVGNPLGFGLSVTVGDVNEDGWPDIFVGNDFLEQDYLYINQKNGRFEDQLQDRFQHTSHFSMGSDLADINNDGLPDLMVLDMLPEDNVGQKILKGADNYDLHQKKVENGFFHQYMRNSLQLNLGNGRFAEIGQVAGVSNTDWSWSPLLADYDNDGLKDMFITNGYVRASTHLDFISYDYPAMVQQIQKSGGKIDNGKISKQMPTIRRPDYFFRNQGNASFANVSSDWGLRNAHYSNGAAYGDLDGDGDLDIVISHLKENCSLLENQSRQLGQGHYLRVELSGTQRIGTKVFVNQGKEKLYQELVPVRGFQSSVEPILHFGLGAATAVESVDIIWPDQKRQRIVAPAVDQILKVTYAPDADQRPAPVQEPIFRPLPKRNASFVHTEDAFIDFKRELLLPRMLSRMGPCLASADVDGNGLEDFFVGGGSGQSGRLFLQQDNGSFRNRTLGAQTEEQTDAVFFDADGDGDQDLYCVHGGYAFDAGSANYQDQLFLNDGKGNFRLQADALPQLHFNGSCVAAHDYDGDGDQDLFIGGDALPGKYPLPEGSALLQNDGGRFKEVSLGGQNVRVGLVRDVEWINVDQDKELELVVVGEWEAVQIFDVVGGTLQPKTQHGLEGIKGWWHTVYAADFDGDGDQDLVLGNRGLNDQVQASEARPAAVYAADFDNNGSIDPVLTHFLQGKEVPVATRDELIKQLPHLKRKFVRYESYANASIAQVFGPEELAKATKWTATNFNSCYAENLGDGRFQLRALPMAAQRSPVRSVQSLDVNQDGHLDMIIAGNDHGMRAESGRHDAGVGLLLLGDGQGNWEVSAPLESGLYLSGDVRDMQLTTTKSGQKRLIVVENNGPVSVWRINSQSPDM
ncbi:MAG: VCBS repeat-containing protein [Bacteroidota bacterium]